MHYKITKQFPHQAERECARFNDVNDAKLAMNLLFTRDKQQKTNVIYRLHDKYGDIILQLDTTKDSTDGSISVGDAASDAAGASSTSSFRPTPLSTTPTPPGMPKKWHVTDEDNKDKDKE